MLWVNENMMYMMESTMLRMWFATVLVCLDKLIHQLGQYVRHLIPNTSQHNVSQFLSQRANTKISSAGVSSHHRRRRASPQRVVVFSVAIGCPLPYTRVKTRVSESRQLKTSRLRSRALVMYSASTAAIVTSWFRLLANRLTRDLEAAAADLADTTLWQYRF